MKFSGVALVLVLFAGQSLAETCKTCKGADCLVKDVFQLDCKKFVPSLPFESQLVSFGDEEQESEFGCLDLQYYIGDNIEHLQQCIISNNLMSYCSMLENTLKVESCSVEATSISSVPSKSEDIFNQVAIAKEPLEVRNERSVDEVEVIEEGSGDDPDGTTQNPNSGSGVVNLISLTAFLAIFISLLA